MCVGLCLSKNISIIDLPPFYMQCDFVGISCYVSIFFFQGRSGEMTEIK